MSDERLAEQFRALSDPTRLRIFRSLMEVTLQGSGAGLSAGEVSAKVAGSSKINSTVSHHLKELRQAGLIEVKRRGRHMICSAKPDGVREMLSFLLDVE